MEPSSYKHVLLLDYCSEKNRGDAAMQVGLIKLVQKYLPQADISVVSVFGANQILDFQTEYDHTLKMPVRLLGGLKPTFFPLNPNIKRSNILVELLNLLFVAISCALLLLVALRIPLSLIARFLPAEYRKTLYAIRDADLIFWNGRNFRSRKNRLLETYRIFNVVYHPLLCKLLSKPMVCIGASLWDLNSSLSRRLAKSAFDYCAFISFRERNSYVEASKLLNAQREGHFRLLPDLSFASFGDVDTLVRQHKKDNRKIPQKVGITVVDWRANGQNARCTYEEALLGVIRFFIANDSEILLIPQVTKKWEGFGGIWKDIYSELNSREKSKITVIEGEPGIDDLLGIYSQIDFLIATRLHSAIFASTVQTPLVAISYDSGGKWGILDEIGYKDYIIPFPEISSSRLIEKILECWNNKEAILDEVRKNTDRFLQQVDLNVIYVVSPNTKDHPVIVNNN